MSSVNLISQSRLLVTLLNDVTSSTELIRSAASVRHFDDFSHCLRMHLLAESITESLPVTDGRPPSEQSRPKMNDNRFSPKLPPRLPLADIPCTLP